MSQSRLASVVITTYKQAPYIGPILEGVFGRTYRHDEVIVVNGGSTGAVLANPESGLIVADGVEFDGPRIIKDSLTGAPMRRLMEPATPATTLWAQRYFLNANFVFTASQVMVPREVLRRVGPSDISLALGGVKTVSRYCKSTSGLRHRSFILGFDVRSKRMPLTPHRQGTTAGSRATTPMRASSYDADFRILTHRPRWCPA